MDTQEHIETRILSALQSFDLVEWEESTLIRLVSSQDTETGQKALLSLRDKGMVTNNLCITEDGIIHYENAVRRPQADIGAKSKTWKDEAISGIKTKKSSASNFTISCESDIHNAVMTNNSIRHRNNDTPDFLLEAKQQKSERIFEIAKLLKIKPEKAALLLKENRIRICKGEDGTEKHLGIFHRDGKSWKKLCKECRKKTN